MTEASQTYNQLVSEMDLPALQLLPEVFNTLLLVTGIFQMYHGIEISHPVYLVLFCNLLAAMFSSLIDVVAFPVLSIGSFEMLLVANGVFCLIFHCISWEAVSILRYVYIVYPDWIGGKIPAEKNLCRFSMAFVLAQYTIEVLFLLGVLIISDWPKIRVVEMPKLNMMVSIAAILINLLIPVIVSIVFSLLLIAKRGKIGLNKVDIQEVKQSAETQPGNIELRQDFIQEVNLHINFVS